MNCRAEMGDDMLFCPLCGAKNENHDIICPKCGAKSDAESSFCRACGTQLRVGAADELAEQRRENMYGIAKNTLDGNLEGKELGDIIKQLEELGDYKDAPALLEKCKEIEYTRACEKFEKANADPALYPSLEKAFERLGNYKDSEEKHRVCKEHCDASSAKKKKKLIIAVVAVLAVIAAAVVTITVVLPAVSYNNAAKALSNGEYLTAIEGFTELEDYKDSATQLKASYFLYGKSLLEAEDFTAAISAFSSAGDYTDAKAYHTYASGKKALAEKDYLDAITLFNTVSVEDSRDCLIEAKYLYAETLFGEKNYQNAKRYYQEVGEYKEAKVKATACDLMEAEAEYKKGNLNAAKTAYGKLPSDFSFNGISVQQRLDFLKKNASFVNACGSWSASKDYIETRQYYKRNGSSDAWIFTDLQTDQTIQVRCILTVMVHSISKEPSLFTDLQTSRR
jgi:TolA-binding protein/ribosomal protein L40E